MNQLKKSVQELDRVETIKNRWNQYATTRDVVSNFSGGNIDFKIDVPQGSMWDPRSMYLRTRLLLDNGTNGGNTQPVLLDGVTFQQDTMAHMFEGVELLLDGKTVCRIRNFIPQIQAIKNRQNKTKSYVDSIDASLNFSGLTYEERVLRVSSDSPITDDIVSNDREFCWTPPLSITELPHDLPGGNWMLRCIPHSQYKQRLVQSAGTKTVLTDYNITISELYLYVNTYEPVVDQIQDSYDYIIDLPNNIEVFSDAAATQAAFHHNTTTIPQNTVAITVAFQDAIAGSSTVFSESEFTILGGGEQNLNRISINYAGQTFGVQEPTPNHFSGMYLNSIMDSKLLMHGGESGGVETLYEFLERGLYTHVATPKQSNDLSSSAVVSYGWGTTVAPCNILVFSHAQQYVAVKMKNGLVESVQLEYL
jgi:hypothetical protein